MSVEGDEESSEIKPPAPSALSVRAIERLAETVEFPIVLSEEVPMAKKMAAALITRIIGSAQAAGRVVDTTSQSDLSAIVRSAYEHLVMLAWVTGSNQDDRVRAWQADDLRERRRVIRELNELEGLPVTGDRDLEALEAEISTFEKSDTRPTLVDRAQQADADWRPTLIGEQRSLLTLSALYSSLYRSASSKVHPSLGGLNEVTQEAGSKVVFYPEPLGEDRKLLGMTVSLLALGLMFANKVIGVSSKRDIDQIFLWLATEPEEFD